jgi:hypothetical protein
MKEILQGEQKMNENYFFIRKYSICVWVLLCFVSFLWLIATASAQTRSGEQGPSQFTAQHNFADDNSRELFTFIYYNVPDNLKEKVMQQYDVLLKAEKSAINRDKLVQITNANMPAAMKPELKARINAEMQKFISYQNSKQK